MGAYIDRGFVIPEAMLDGIALYLNFGILPGSFLRAVISDSLSEACAHADAVNLHNLPAYVTYFFNEVQSEAWGSKEKMIAWSEKMKAGRKGGLPI